MEDKKFYIIMVWLSIIGSNPVESVFLDIMFGLSAILFAALAVIRPTSKEDQSDG